MLEHFVPTPAPAPVFEIDINAISGALNSIDYLGASEKRSLPPNVLSKLRSLGLFSMSAPRKLGGLGMTPAEIMPIIKLLGFHDCSIAVWVSLHNLLSAPALYDHEPACLPLRDLTSIALGDSLVAYALTEEDAGSDPRKIRSTAVETNGRFVLSGRKCWTGIGAWADYTLFFAQTRGARGEPRGITAFLLSRATDTIEYLGEHLTLGLRGVIQNAFQVDRLEIGAERIIGRPGTGLKLAKERMAVGRMAVAAMACGALARCLLITGEFGDHRIIATGRLSHNPAWEFLLNSAKLCYLICENVLQLTVSAAIRNPSDGEVYYTVAKIINSLLSHYGADLCVQALGGRGYDEEFGVSRFFRDTRVFSIFEGSNGSLLYFVGRSVQVKVRDGSLPTFAGAMNLDLERLTAMAEDYQAFSHRERIETANRLGLRIVLEAVSVAAGIGGCDVGQAITLIHHVLSQRLYDPTTAKTLADALVQVDQNLQTSLYFYGAARQPSFPLSFQWRAERQGYRDGE